MSVNNNSMEQAEITYFFEKLSNTHPYRDAQNRHTVRQLPWCQIRFGDDGEDRKYVQPLPPNALICGGGNFMSHYRDINFTESSSAVTKTFGVSFMEFAPFLPFPLESGRPAPGSPAGIDSDIPGPYAIHFFGGV